MPDHRSLLVRRSKPTRSLNFLFVELPFFNLNEFMTIFSFSQWLTQAIAGLKEGRNAERKAFLPCPRIQIVTEVVATKTHPTCQAKKLKSCPQCVLSTR